MNPEKLKKDFQEGRIDKAAFIQEMSRCHDHLHRYADLIKGTNVASIEITDGQVAMTTRSDGIKLVYSMGDPRAAVLEMLNFGDYEPGELAAASALLEPGETLIDAGANIGWYALSLAKRVEGLKVFAFEPFPETYDRLIRNVALNEIPSVRAFDFGFGETEETKTLYYSSQGSANVSSANLMNDKSARRVDCRLKRLDDFTASEGIAVDFIKIDVEGAELFVLRGALETIERDRPVVAAEMLRKWASAHGYHPNEIVGLLAKSGYRCFTVSAGKLVEFSEMDENTVETNFFFLHPERHARKIARLS
jgi:FkbM family methyltransferase